MLGELFKSCKNSSNGSGNNNNLGLMITLGLFSNSNNNNNSDNNNESPIEIFKNQNSKIKELKKKINRIVDYLINPKNSKLSKIILPDLDLVSKNVYQEKKGITWLSLLYLDLTADEHDILCCHFSSLKDIQDNNQRNLILSLVGCRDWSSLNINFLTIGFKNGSNGLVGIQDYYYIDYKTFLMLLFSEEEMCNQTIDFLNSILKLDKEFLEFLKYKDYQFEIDLLQNSKLTLLKDINIQNQNSTIVKSSKKLLGLDKLVKKNTTFKNKSDNNNIMITLFSNNLKNSSNNCNNSNSSNKQNIIINKNSTTTIQASDSQQLINIGFLNDKNQQYINVILYNLVIKSGDTITIRQNHLDQILFSCLLDDFENNLTFKYIYLNNNSNNDNNNNNNKGIINNISLSNNNNNNDNSHHELNNLESNFDKNPKISKDKSPVNENKLKNSKDNINNNNSSSNNNNYNKKMNGNSIDSIDDGNYTPNNNKSNNNNSPVNIKKSNNITSFSKPTATAPSSPSIRNSTTIPPNSTSNNISSYNRPTSTSPPSPITIAPSVQNTTSPTSNSTSNNISFNNRPTATTTSTTTTSSTNNLNNSTNPTHNRSINTYARPTATAPSPSQVRSITPVQSTSPKNTTTTSTTTSTTSTTSTNNNNLNNNLILPLLPPPPSSDLSDHLTGDWVHIPNYNNSSSISDVDNKEPNKYFNNKSILLSFTQFQELVYSDELFLDLKFETIELRKVLQSIFIHITYFRINPFSKRYWVEHQEEIRYLFQRLHNEIKNLIKILKSKEEYDRNMVSNSGARPFFRAAASLFGVNSLFIEPALIVSDKLFSTINDQVNRPEIEERKLLLDRLYNIISFSNEVFLEIYLNIDRSTFRVHEILNTILEK